MGKYTLSIILFVAGISMYLYARQAQNKGEAINPSSGFLKIIGVALVGTGVIIGLSKSEK